MSTREVFVALSNILDGDFWHGPEYASGVTGKIIV